MPIFFTDREDMRRQWGDLVKDRKLVELAWSIRNNLKMINNKACDMDKISAAERDTVNQSIDAIHL